MLESRNQHPDTEGTSMNSRDWADLASVYRAGAAKASEWRAASGLPTGQDLILQAMADRCGQLSGGRAAEEEAERAGSPDCLPPAQDTC
jgi:hypothetical protein